MIKRYKNRKLYHVENAIYVTLPEAYYILVHNPDERVISVADGTDLTDDTIVSGALLVDYNFIKKSVLARVRRKAA